MKVKLMCGV